MANRQHDIEKYLRGEMTPAEQHAFEKAALNDPFLQDALEGAEELQANEFSNDLKDINHLLEKRTSKKNKVISLWGWSARIAAGLVILVASVVLLWNVLNQQPANELALTKTEETTSTTTPPNQIYNTDSVSASTTTPEASPSSTETKPITNNRLALTEENIQDDKEVMEDAIALAEEPKVIKQPALALEDKEEDQAQAAPVISPPTEVQSETREISKAKVARRDAAPAEGYISQQKEEPSTTIKGKVTTEDGIALPGVNVVIKGTATGTVTDVYGNYQLPVLDPNQSLVFSFVGMESQELAVLDKQNVNVQLEPDVSSLSEVVVVGYSESDDENEEPKIELATPEGGRAAYKQYLEKNLRYPDLALENNIEGRVTIQFTVDSFGKLSDFKVIKGLGFGCDEEVIRLIQQGPKWIPTKKDSEPVSDNVRVKMRFKSPKK